MWIDDQLRKGVEMVKTRPIIFSEKMTRAILNGRKTQTRRIINEILHGTSAPGIDDLVAKKEAFIFDPDIPYYITCPHGKPGDRFWVRETIIKRAFEHQAFDGATYAADLTPVMGEGPLGSYCSRAILDWKWKRNKLSSLFMPRWASRLTLEITNIRVEKLQEITKNDVVAEGIPQFTFSRGVLSDDPPDPRWRFIELWDSINAKKGYSWSENPWVWAITFQIVDDDD